MTTPTNGTTAPTTNGATATQQPAPATQTQSEPDWKAKLAEAESREVQAKRELVVGRQQWQREKQTFGEKLKAADAFERLKKTASVDKVAAARELLGENFLEDLQQQAASGAISPAQLQRNLEQVRADTIAEIEERTRKQEEARKGAETTAETQARSHLGEETAFFYEQVEKEFPLLGALGDKDEVGKVLASNINGPMFMRFRQALANGDADARVKLYREAAVKLEDTLAAIAERAAGHEKYQPKLREKLTPVKVAGTVTPSSQSLSPSPSSQSQSQQGRRSLNNDIATGSTPPADSPKFLSDEERRAKALAKYHEAVAAKSGR